MRAVIICAEPELAVAERDSIPAVLADLGCATVLGRFDLGGLDEEALLRTPPNVVVVEAGDDLVRAQRAIKKLRSGGVLADAPVLLALTLPRLPALDFSTGFDDFVLLPLVPAELYARLRQLDWKTATFGSEEVLKIEDLVIDIAGHEAKVGGRPLPLTHQEFELLRFLAQHRGRVFSRDQLLERVWGYSYGGGTRTRRTWMSTVRVRAKMGVITGGLIETVRNVGYKMRGSR